MSSSVDLAKIPLLHYMEMLKKQNLLPGRKILLEHIDENFQRISATGVQNLADLKKSLSSPQRLAAFSLQAGVPEDYLTILKREMGSLQKKPASSADFPGATREELSGLRDLVRINGVGPAAARTLYEAGYKSAAAIAKAKAPDLLVGMNAVNADKQYYKAKLGEKDMQFIIDAANIMLETELL